MASKVVLPENPGHMKVNGTTRVRIEYVLTFNTNDTVEAGDTPLQRRRMRGNKSTPNPGLTSSSLNSGEKEVI